VRRPRPCAASARRARRGAARARCGRGERRRGGGWQAAFPVQLTDARTRLCQTARAATDYDARRANTNPARLTRMPKRYDRSELLALLALLFGALAIGGSAIFVRLAETGPSASAFWRGALALPALAVWMLLERRPDTPPEATLARSWRDPIF